MAGALRLSFHFAERARSGGALVADRALELCARHSIDSSVLLRGVEGFGMRHPIQTERLLSLGEDLPLLLSAVDRPAAIEQLAAELVDLGGHGLISLEPCEVGAMQELSGALGGDGGRISLLIGRRERAGGRAAHLAAVDCMHRHGLTGAWVLLGLDGTRGGTRQRARFLAANGAVPMLVEGVGPAPALEGVLAELRGLLGPSATATLSALQPARAVDGPSQPAPGWRELTLVAGAQVRRGERPLQGELVRRLALAGARGATTLRAQWGFFGTHRPHGERFLSLARHSPLVTVVLDEDAAVEQWEALARQLLAGQGPALSAPVRVR